MGKGYLILSQQVTDELKVKLPKTEQYKLMKAESFNDKGKALLDKGGNLPDNLKITNPNPSKEDKKKIDNYYTNRIKASYCFKTSNGLIYEVVEKYIKGFWEKFKGDKRSLESVLKVQNAANDSLVIADNLRAKAETENDIEVTVPLVSRAEVMERVALFKLQKILLIYMNWPEKPNMAWLNSNDTNVPQNLAVNNTPSKIEPAKKDTLHKASNIYTLMHISDNQVDKFNEFLKEKHPDKMQAYLIDFQGLYQDVIDSLHKEWHKYLYSGSVAQDTLTLLLKSSTNPGLSQNSGTNQPANVKLDNKVATNKPTETSQNSTANVSTEKKTGDPKESQKSVSNGKISPNETIKKKPLDISHQNNLKKDSTTSVKIKPSKQFTVNKVGKSVKSIHTTASVTHDFLFKVQIAACRHQLNREDLQSIYQGNEKIVEVFETNWFKYSIGTFSSLNEALDLRDKANVKGVFVAAYFKGKRVKIPQSIKKQANR